MKLESIALIADINRTHNQGGHHTHISNDVIYFDNTQHGADLFDLKVEGNIYSRIMNPTNAVLEQRLAEMEGGIASLALASGMAAITYAIQCITRVGDNIVSANQLYGGTYNLFAHTLPQMGIKTKLVDIGNFSEVEAAIDEIRKPYTVNLLEIL